MAYEWLENNKNAEKWTLEAANEFMKQSLELAKERKHDFIGEVARDMNQYRELYVYLTDKYPQLKHIYKKILQECETNCFSHGKKGDINTAMAIVNLKSNHGWTDRIDTTTKGETVKDEIDYSKLSTETLREIANASKSNKSES